MQLEQSGRQALRAAEASDLEGLRIAIEARAAAVAEMAAEDPSERLRARLFAALDMGEAIHGQIRALKLRIGAESAGLRRIQNGLATGLGSVPERGRVDISL